MEGSWEDPVFAQDRSYTDGSMPPLRRFKFASPGFLRTLGIPLIAGRDFTWAETYQKLPVAVVSENLAREYWGSPANALGKFIRVSTKDDWREIVGVVGDVHDDGMNKDAPTIAYWPILMKHFEGDDESVRRRVVYAIRSSRAGSESLMNDVRRAVWSVDANLPLSEVRTEEYFYSKSMARASFTLVMLAVAASLALLLGIVGSVWRDRLFRVAAHARDWDSNRAGRAAQRGHGNVCAPGTADGRERSGVRADRGSRLRRDCFGHSYSTSVRWIR